MPIRRIEFNEIFQELPEGVLELKIPLEVGQTIYNSGTKFQKGVIYGGIDFHLYKNRAIAVEQEDNIEGPSKLIGFFSD